MSTRLLLLLPLPLGLCLTLCGLLEFVVFEGARSTDHAADDPDSGGENDKGGGDRQDEKRPATLRPCFGHDAARQSLCVLCGEAPQPLEERGEPLDRGGVANRSQQSFHRLAFPLLHGKENKMEDKTNLNRRSQHQSFIHPLRRGRDDLNTIHSFHWEEGMRSLRKENWLKTIIDSNRINKIFVKLIAEGLETAFPSFFSSYSMRPETFTICFSCCCFGQE